MYFGWKIYVIGGVEKNGYFTDNVEVFHPETNSWITAVSYPEPLHHTACAPYDGKLYLVGGFGERNVPTNALYIYYPSKDEWDRGPTMPTARGALSANFIDGILYAVGGSLGDWWGPVFI